MTFKEAADAGHIRALTDLAWLREEAGDYAEAERLYRQAADAGESGALTDLARLREWAGDPESGERFRRFGLDAEGEIEAPWE
ncbi:hypothetical protein ETD83_26635 [Actinomadura soli]|uniref:Tetratricopeptide repeat protein n=1 Tax=Actinomadura soli TaxID=2508997 RepID=A0A5C4J620_9ACTN|nr:hypothetical protein [Actinomadura soli]TMQ92810.1 hypothetical protein ETD83_26635 [Actinomadura soli]